MKTHNHEEKSSAGRIAEETRALLAATADATEETIIEARNRLKSAMQATTDTYLRVKAQAIASAKATDKVIRDNPYRSLAAAFGVGALIGFLWSRRSRD